MKASLVVVAVLLSGCYGLPTDPRPPNGQCSFPPGTHFAFIGVTSGAALGLDAGSGAVGRWWVSSERVSQLWRPLPPGVPIPPPMRQACGIFDDGSTEITSVPENWHLPFNVRH